MISILAKWTVPMRLRTESVGKAHPADFERKEPSDAT
jgi:hypothetical protein